jgi:hypothetical protein
MVNIILKNAVLRRFKINQQRPYYILLFGNKSVIDKALKILFKSRDLGGYVNQSKVFLTKEMKTGYSVVLLNGDEKKGPI